ncbi:hypothetical protein P9848_15355, partial [Geobacillus stearothermophilus]|uniref:hypothetical protein n=1 Tax=Geobacillus stearothermophilus TaxID=1422 RepID=UPI002E24A564|nr:hypothetical protein [Geobacillus stearothermophilus]
KVLTDSSSIRRLLGVSLFDKIKQLQHVLVHRPAPSPLFKPGGRQRRGSPKRAWQGWMSGLEKGASSRANEIKMRIKRVVAWQIQL